MKKHIIIFITASVLMFGCSKSNEDNFNDVNGEVTAKYLTRADVTSSEIPDQVGLLIVNYNGDNKVSSVTDGDIVHFFEYADNNILETINTGLGEILLTENLLLQPYEAFNFGQVIEYDEKGNVSIVEIVMEEDVNKQLLGYFSYDEEHNPYFYTLKGVYPIFCVFEK